VHHALAREKGFKSWGGLKRYDAPVGRFLVAVRGGSIKSAQQELERFPDLLEESIHASCAVGDADAVRYHLELDRTLLNAEADGWDPLLYACGSPFHRLNARHAAGIVESVAVLLDQGADPNQSSAVYRASMNGNRSLAVLLFQRGATPVRASGTPSLVKDAFSGILRDERVMDRTLAELFSDPAAVQKMTTQMEAMRTQYGAWFKKLRGEKLLPRDCYDPAFPENEPYIAMIWKRLIDLGVRPNWRDMCQDTPLHYLAYGDGTRIRWGSSSHTERTRASGGRTARRHTFLRFAPETLRLRKFCAHMEPTPQMYVRWMNSSEPAPV
jgi:hypothetical protein